jgi:hypothetical protein
MCYVLLGIAVISNKGIRDIDDVGLSFNCVATHSEPLHTLAIPRQRKHMQHMRKHMQHMQQLKRMQHMRPRLAYDHSLSLPHTSAG